VPIAPTNQFGAAGGAQGAGEVNDKVKAKGTTRQSTGSDASDIPPPPTKDDKATQVKPEAKPPSTSDQSDKKPEPGQPDTTPGPAPKKDKEVGKMTSVPFGIGLRKRSSPRMISVSVDRPTLALERHHMETAIGSCFAVLGKKAADHIRDSLYRLGKASLFATPIARSVAESVDLSGLGGIATQISPNLATIAQTAADVVLANYPETGSLGADAATIAADQAKRRAAELVGLQYDAQGNIVPFAGAEMSIRDSTVNMMERAIASGIEEGLTADAVSAGIEAVIFGDARAALIAGAEASRANSAGIAIGTQLLGTLGYNARKAWETEGDSKVCADICQMNEMDGYIPMTEHFTSGDLFTPGHPRCRCSIIVQVL